MGLRIDLNAPSFRIGLKTRLNKKTDRYIFITSVPQILLGDPGLESLGLGGRDLVWGYIRRAGFWYSRICVTHTDGAFIDAKHDPPMPVPHFSERPRQNDQGIRG